MFIYICVYTYVYKQICICTHIYVQWRLELTHTKSVLESMRTMRGSASRRFWRRAAPCRTATLGHLFAITDGKCSKAHGRVCSG